MSNSCYHCNEPIPSGFRATLEIAGEQQAFCCYGCQAIAETIVSGGLDNFYQHRTQASLKPDEFTQAQQDELLLYDDPALQEDFVNHEGETSEAALSITGITCAACIWLLEREINALKGVTSFTVNHSTHKAILSWNSEDAALSTVLIHIRHLGYKSFPYQEDNARKLAAKEKRSAMFRIAVAGIAAMQNMMFSVPLYLGIYSGIDSEFISFFRWVSMLMCIPVITFAAVPFFKAALRDLQTRHLTMDIPVSLAILTAFFASSYLTIIGDASIETDVYFDSVAMFTFFLLLGRFLEMQTRHKHLNSDAEMGKLLPSTAIIQVGNEELSKPAHQLKIGDILVIRQGQISPADGIVIDGSSRVDESALTGEFLPVDKNIGSLISGGTANVENTLYVKITATPKQSRVASIIKLLDKAQSDKPKTVLMADRIASHFVAGVLFAATCVGIYWAIHLPDEVFSIVLSVLVVTCPCALSLATPTAMTSANTKLRSKGFLITKSHALEAMPQISDIIFDKTGTLTKGLLSITQVNTFHNTPKSLALEIAAALEHHSSHPIAKPFSEHFIQAANQVTNLLGKGLIGTYSNKQYHLGNLALCSLSSAELAKVEPYKGLSLYLTEDGKLLAQFMLNDALRDDSQASIEQFKAAGIRTHILSGDQQEAVEDLAINLQVDAYRANQSPEQKLAYVKELQSQGLHVAMVGDGINDLPVLSGAKLSIAMAEASDIAKLNSDSVLLNGHMTVINDAFQTALRARKIVKQNISWAIIYNLCMLPLAAVGWVPPYFAALGMSLSSLIVVFNSLRLKRE
jgi:P-type Cu2+ transporter